MSLSYHKFDSPKRHVRYHSIPDGSGVVSASRHGAASSRAHRASASAGLAVIVLALAAIGAGRAHAQEPEPEAGLHVVRTGDTLWDLARQYLSDPFRWPEIYSLNREVVRDPHWIYPQDRLLIPGRRGMVVPPLGVVPTVPTADGRTVFFGGGRAGGDPRTVRMTPADEVAAVEPGAFYRAGLLLSEAEMSLLGELVEVVSPTVVPRRGVPQIQPHDRVLMRVAGSVSVGDRLHLMRAGRVVQPYGRIFVATGSGLVIAVEAGTATIEVDQFYDRVDIGDVALPLPEFAPRSGVVPQPAAGLEGRLLSFIEAQPVAATGDMAFVDLGAASGVVEGDEFVAFIPATAASWGIRPEVEVARLQVVRAGRVTSTVRVVSLQQPALEEGMPVRLVGKMPAASD
jgi:hypothetical protein